MVPMLSLVSTLSYAVSHYAACAQEMDQNIIDKNAAILREKH